MSRFNYNASTNAQAVDYLKARAKQLLRFNFKLTLIEHFKWGVIAYFEKGDKVFQSIYILDQFRGQGIYQKHVEYTVLTSKQCGIEEFLEAKKIAYLSVDLEPFEEYKIIQDYFGARKTKRSKVFLMNHIDEGLAILEDINASELAKKTYCLHPILQYKDDFNAHYNSDIISEACPQATALAVEYRHVANSYLSTETLASFKGFTNKDIKDMLYADKLQNEKDFTLYHEGTHPRSKELRSYFDSWLNILLVDYKQ